MILSTKGGYKPKLSMLLLFCSTELSEEKQAPSNLLTFHFYLISSEFYPLMFSQSYLWLALGSYVISTCQSRKYWTWTSTL